MKIVVKFYGSEEVVGVISLDRSEDFETNENPQLRRLAFMGYSGGAEYNPVDNDTAVILRVSGFDKFKYTAGDKDVPDELNDNVPKGTSSDANVDKG